MPKMPNSKAILVVGPGLIGKKHIELINKNTRCHLKAIVAPDHPHDHEIANKNNVKLYHTIGDAIKKESIDGVIIASPNLYHVDQAIACIKNNIPVLLEKPISHSIPEAERLIDIIESTSNSKLIIGHHRAHSPIMLHAKTIISGGTIGQPVSIMGSAQFYKPNDYFLSGPWRKEVGGGPILINLIHEIHNLRILCGEISAVHSFSSNKIRGFAVEDTVSINMHFKSGALGTFILSDTAASVHSWEMTSGENTAYPHFKYVPCYTIAGTNGTLEVPTMKIYQYKDINEKSWWTRPQEFSISIDKKDPLECQLEHFINLIDGNETPRVSAYDGLQNLIVTEAIQRSSMTDQIVYLDN